MDLPNGRERKVLQILAINEWENRAQLYCGEITFNSLCEKGWIMPFPGWNPNDDRFCITDAGRAAYDAPPAPKLPKRPGFKTAPPRIAVLPPRYPTAPRKPKR